jgi:hypothetical protein
MDSSTTGGVFSGARIPLRTMSQRHASIITTSAIAEAVPIPNQATTIGNRKRKIV